MDKRTRLTRTFQLEKADRPPILGGWLAAPNHVQALTGCTEAEYYADPIHWGIEADRILDSDGLIDVFKPVEYGAYRIVNSETLEKRASYSVEAVLAEIASQPDVAEIRSSFDEPAAYAQFLQVYQERQAMCGEMLWCPAYWDVLPIALWYHTFGYETTFTTLALYPDEYRKLIHTSAEKARLKSGLIARAIREGLHPKAILTGEDLCSQKGPMVSPAYLQREYWHLVEYAFEPLYEAGAKIVWHCDGDVRPLLPDILAIGVAGLQGFQRACGMELEWIVDLRTRRGDPLLIFGPMEVATKFCTGTPEEVRQEVRHSMALCRDKAALAFFTSNTITPDIPIENIRAYWEAVHNSRW